MLGRTFTNAGARRDHRAHRERARRAPRSLVRKEVLAITIDPLLSERGQYGFLQDLVKKVAYDTMSRRERKARHLAAATYLRTAFDEDEIVEVVASHLLEAYRAAPDDEDAGKISGDALAMLAKASERAASLGANQESQHYAERAVELAEDPLVEAELHERAGTAAVASLDIEPAIEHFRRAIALFEGHGATHPAARVSARLGEAVWTLGRGADAIETMEASYRVLADEEPDEALAQLAAQLGRVSFFAGDVERALDRIERALEIAEALDLPEVLSDALNTKCLIMIALGRQQESVGLLRHALEIALEHDKPAAALRAFNNLADGHTTMDRYEEADRFVEDGLALARKVGNRYWESSLLGHCYAKFALGRWDELLAAIGEIPLDEFARARLGFNQGYVAFGTAIDVHRGDLDSAADRLGRFVELGTSADVQEVAEYACGAARYHLATGDPKEALRFAELGLEGRETLSLTHFSMKESLVVALEAALELDEADKLEDLLVLIRSDAIARRTRFHRAHVARVEARSGDEPDDEVDRLFTSSVDTFRSINFPFWTAVTLLEQGEWLDAIGRSSDAAPLAAEARPIFEGLAAKPWVDRAGRVGEASTVTS